MQNRITQGVIWKQILLFFGPIWFGTFFQQLYNTADAVIVGNFVGKNALAAVGATGVVMNLLVGFFVGIASGASVIISQHYGADEPAEVGRAVHTAMALGLVGGVVLMVVGVLFTPWMLRAMGTPADILADAVLYLRVCFLGMIPSLIYNVGTGILRAVGDSRRPLNFLIVASVTNIVLDFVFVVFFKMGVLGVALGTVISQSVSAILTLANLLHTPDCYRVEASRLGFDRLMLRRIIHIGLPAGLQSVMYSASNVVVQASVNAFGTNVVAAYTAYGKIDSVFWMTMNSFGLSITTFSGQNFGAGLYDRIKKGVRQCTAMAFGCALLLMTFVLGFGPTLLRFFVQDEAVIAQGLILLKLLVPVWPTYILIEVLSGTLRGVGDSVVPMVLCGLGVCLLRVVWISAIAMPVWHSLTAVLACYPISWSLTSLMFLIYYLKGGWLRRRIAAGGRALPGQTPEAQA